MQDCVGRVVDGLGSGDAVRVVSLGELVDGLGDSVREARVLDSVDGSVDDADDGLDSLVVRRA